jgi:hypothetical protein
MYVFEVHRPTLMIVSVDAPASFNAMAPPERRLWDDTLLSVYPRSSNPSLVAPQRTAIVMSRSDTRVGCLSRWKTVLIGHCLEPGLILYNLLANAATGHRCPPMASWCTTAFFVPFLVLAMHIVALSAVRRVARGAFGLRSTPRHHKRMSHLRSAIVRFTRCAVGAGVVYSPTRRR